MPQMSQRSWKILQDLRERASPRFYDPVKPPDQVRREAKQRLAAMDYAGKPIEVGRGLAAQLREIDG